MNEVATHLPDLMSAMKKLQSELGRQVTQTEISNETGIAKSTLSRIMNGEVLPKEETINKLASYFSQLTGKEWKENDFYRTLTEFEAAREKAMEGILGPVQYKAHRQQRQQRQVTRNSSTPSKGNLARYPQRLNQVVLPEYTSVPGKGAAANHELSQQDTHIFSSQYAKRANSLYRYNAKDMEPTINKGDLLFIEDGINWLNGTVVLVRKGEMRLCRRYYRQDTQELLTPDNPVFEPFLLNRAEGDEVIGRVVRSSREY